MKAISYSLVFILILGIAISHSSAVVKETKAVPSSSSKDISSRYFPNYYKFHVVSARVSGRRTLPPPPPRSNPVLHQSPPPPVVPPQQHPPPPPPPPPWA
ncbi:hypothetical protein COLO4_15460 [Corchorus olitorius]|uniref:Uncharacterized protein n=1 Tax=Corchorus olitorius TaxID=93759 RepID=A0A1R3JMT5_9ROSI|nr:hypothetical protein COLO4_15460 [Corchorus olitorius]